MSSTPDQGYVLPPTFTSHSELHRALNIERILPARWSDDQIHSALAIATRLNLSGTIDTLTSEIRRRDFIKANQANANAAQTIVAPQFPSLQARMAATFPQPTPIPNVTPLPPPTTQTQQFQPQNFQR